MLACFQTAVLEKNTLSTEISTSILILKKRARVTHRTSGLLNDETSMDKTIDC